MKRLLLGPVCLMLLVWGVFAAMFVFGPLDYYREPRSETWLAILVGILTFAAGRALAGESPPSGGQPAPTPPREVARIILWSSWAGLFGIAALTVDKVLLSGLDYSAGLAAIRFQRSAEVAAGVDIARSPLLYLGYLTFSFSYAAILLFYLYAEDLPKGTARLAQLSVISPIVYALLYGGRAPILLLGFLVFGAAVARLLGGRRMIPHAHRIGVKLLLLGLAFLTYVNFTWADRRTYSNIQDYDDYLAVASEAWALKPKPWMDEAIRQGDIDAESAMDGMSLWLYATHSVTTLDKLLDDPQRFSPYLGAYEIGVLAPLLRVFFPDVDLVQQMTDDLQASDTFGWFEPAWGALFLDFGVAGALAGSLLWGYVTGYAYRRTQSGGSATDRLLLSFCYAGILASPLNSPIGMANSQLILLSLLTAPVLARLRWRRPIAPTAPIAEGGLRPPPAIP